MMISWRNVYSAGIQRDYDRARQLLSRLSGEKAAKFLALAATQMDQETRHDFLWGVVGDTDDDVPPIEAPDPNPRAACAWHNTYSAECRECQLKDPAAELNCECDTDGPHWGWLHMTDSCGNSQGVERCDLCGVYATDEEAAEAHAALCRCGLGLAEGGE